MKYKYDVGDKVLLRGKKYIVLEKYYPKGYGFEGNIPAYSIYPPGKKKSYGHHCWAYETDLLSHL